MLVKWCQFRKQQIEAIIVICKFERLNEYFAIGKAQQLEQLLLELNAPITVEEIGQEKEKLPLVFMATKDIRDKYVLSRLAWDLGVIEELNVCTCSLCQ